VREVIDVSDGALAVHVTADSDSDDAELEELAGRLRDELLELDVASVEPTPDEDIPAQAKGLGAVVGWLTVHLGTERLRTVVKAVRGWAARTNRSVEVSIDGDVLKLSNVTDAQQDRIIEAWLQRHAASA
jgi:hypothetical protein